MFTLKMETDNAAFDGYPAQEIYRILRRVGASLGRGDRSGKCLDANGNSVGSWELVS